MTEGMPFEMRAEDRFWTEYRWIPLHESPPEGWRYADRVPSGAPDPRDMRGHRLIMRYISSSN